MNEKERKSCINTIETLRRLAYNIHGVMDVIDDQNCKAIIEMLEAEPCEDAISRQAVLDATVKRNSIWNAITNSKGENLEEIISQLPPVTPQPKTGHWKVVSDGYGDNAYICECSECKDTIWVYKDADRKWNYCPNCGADMRTKAESEELNGRR